MNRSVLGAAIVFVLLGHLAWGQTGAPPAVVQPGPNAAPDELTPEEAAYRKSLLDELTNLQKLDFPVQVTADPIENLTAADLKFLMNFAHQTHDRLEASAPNSPVTINFEEGAGTGLSSAGRAVMPFIVQHEQRVWAGRHAPGARGVETAIAASPPVLETVLPADLAAYKQSLLDDIDTLQKVAVVVPEGDRAVQALSPGDLKIYADFAASVAAQIKSLPNDVMAPPLKINIDPAKLSPVGQFLVPLVITREERRYMAAHDKMQKEMPAVNVAGRPTEPEATRDQSLAYLRTIESHPFCVPWPPDNNPPVLRDERFPDRTENNWIARLIVEDITAQVIAGLHLPQPMNAVHAHVQVEDQNPLLGTLHISFDQWLDNPSLIDRLTQPYHVDFAWDGLSYAPLAEYLIGSHPLPAATPDPAANKLLGNLLRLSGAVLAREDRRISARLQSDPLDASAQSEAALILAALAWRENAGDYSDNRRLLCKATAHLALAVAVDSLNKTPPDWNAGVAGALLRALSGREADTLQRIDGALADKTIPADAKTWLTTIRFWSKGDWRDAKVDTASPLLTKIAWFQILCADLPDLVASAKFDKLGAPIPVPDWNRAILNRPTFSVESGNRFAEAAIDLELREATDVAHEENMPITDESSMKHALATFEDDTVAFDAKNNPVIKVIGFHTFMAATRRHLLNTVGKTDEYMRNYLGDPDGAAAFETQVTSLMQDMPYFVTVATKFPTPDGSTHETIDGILRSRGATWGVADLPPAALVGAFVVDYADMPLWNQFYGAGEPVGTVYDLPHRQDAIDRLHVDADWHRDPSDPLPQTILDGRRHYYTRLLPLSPDSCPLAIARVTTNHGIGTGDTAEQAIAELKPFMDYCIGPFDTLLQSQPGFALTDDQEEMLLRKEAALNPDIYFRLGTLLRNQNRLDEAAEADRKGAAQAYDQVAVANSVRPLIDYDMAHSRTDEALALAKKAADVYSADGINTYMTVLEKLGRLDEAAKWGRDLRDRYGYTSPLSALYFAHPDHFSPQLEALRKEIFPAGTTTVSLTSFSGPPNQGEVFTSASPLLTNAGLQQGDVVVALNSVKIENDAQYCFIRDGLRGPDLDLIVWNGSQYRDVHASPPGHMFNVTMATYPLR